MKVIPLTQGQETMVDDCDADLAALKWCATFNPGYTGGGKYVVRRRPFVIQGNVESYLHRAILARVLGHKLLPTEEVDHIDLNPLNNQRNNLRLATISQNQHNRPKRADNTSGYKGVSYYKRSGKWCAQIAVEGKTRRIGYFPTAEEAAKAYDDSARKLHKEFAFLNFPDRNPVGD